MMIRMFSDLKVEIKEDIWKQFTESQNSMHKKSQEGTEITKWNQKGIQLAPKWYQGNFNKKR
jgi:hypothetical protein